MGPALQLGIEAFRHVSVQSLLLLALALRFVLTIFTTLNVQWNYDDLPTDPPVHVHIELVDIAIVGIGFLLFAVNGVATIDTLLCLWDYLTKKEKRPKIRDLVIWRNGFIFAVTAECVLFALRMFVFVRSKWTSNLCMVIQVLHLFPTLSVVSQAVLNGILICLTPVLKADQMLAHPNYNKAVTAHKVSNGIAMVYAVLNAAIFLLAVPESQNYFIIPIPCCVLLELLCRFVLLHQMERPEICEKILYQISGYFNVRRILMVEGVTRRLKKACAGQNTLHRPVEVPEYDPKLIQTPYERFYNLYELYN